MSPAKVTEKTIQIPGIQIQTMQIPLVNRSESTLITHGWTEKARKMILDKQSGEAKTKKEFKVPHDDYIASLYLEEDGHPVFPSVAFKAAAVRAGTMNEMKMTALRQAFFVRGEYVPIYGEHHMRQDMVRVGMGVADVRFRAEFDEWYTVLDVEFIPNLISADQIYNLFNFAGFGVGIGDWRPEKSGDHGMFTLATGEDAEEMLKHHNARRNGK